MNNKIQELSEQAEKYADDNFRGEPTWSEAFESKFAELIVLECAGLLKKEAESGHDKGTDTYNLLLRESNWMKRYFGVE